METLATWGAVAVVLAALSGLGRLLPGQGPSAPVGPLWAGWGLLIGLLTLYVAVVPAGLTPFLAAMAGLAVAGYVQRRPTRPELERLGLLLVLALPLFWVWSHNHVFAWDDFAHRLPSYWFATHFDALPNPSLPPSLSVWPGYPYGLTVLGVAVSRLMGHYTELAIAMINGAVTVTFAGVLAAFLAGDKARPAWKIVAAGLVLTAVANPYVNKEFMATAYQEASLSLAMAVTFLAMRPTLTSLRVPTLAESLHLGLLLTLIVGLKQVGAVLAFLLGGPFMLLVAFRLRQTPVRALATLALLGAPMLGVWALWGWYVRTQIGGGEFVALPWAQWHFGLWPAMLHSFGKVLLGHPMTMGGLFILSGLTVGAFRGSRLAAERLPLLLATYVGWGYFAFLILTYFATFSDYEAAGLASFHRYMQHVNWLIWVVLVGAARAYMPAKGKAWRALPFALPALLLVPLVVPQLYVRKPNPEVAQMQAFAQQLPALLPPLSSVRVDEPQGLGFRYFVLKYYAGYAYEILPGRTALGAWGVPDANAPTAVVTVGDPTAPVHIQMYKK